MGGSDGLEIYPPLFCIASVLVDRGWGIGRVELLSSCCLYTNHHAVHQPPMSHTLDFHPRKPTLVKPYLSTLSLTNPAATHPLTNPLPYS